MEGRILLIKCISHRWSRYKNCAQSVSFCSHFTFSPAEHTFRLLEKAKMFDPPLRWFKYVEGRIRTPVGISHWILSPARLATPAPPHNKRDRRYLLIKFWLDGSSARLDEQFALRKDGLKDKKLFFEMQIVSNVGTST